MANTFSIKNELGLAPAKVRALYMFNTGVQPAIAESTKAEYLSIKENFSKEIAALKFEPGYMYNVALAGAQHTLYEDGLLSVGFHLVETFKNPNSPNTIRFYVKDAI